MPETMTDINLMQGDCLERMKEIPSGSVDMVLTDPPYGTMKGAGLDGWAEGKTNWDIDDLNEVATAVLAAASQLFDKCL